MAVLVILFAAFVVFLFYHLRSLRRADLPPGPKPWPLLGNFPTIIIAGWRGVPVLEVLKRWKREYGNCYTFWLGPIPTVHVVDYKTAVDAYVRNAEVHTGRMKAWQLTHMRGNMGIALAEGAEWQEQRRFSLRVLRNFGVGKNLMQERILEECKHRFDELKAELTVAEGGKMVMNLAPMFDLLVGSIINSLIAGYRFDKSNESEFFYLKHQIDELMTEWSIGESVIFTPTTIKWLFVKERWERWIAPQKATAAFVRKLIENRRAAIEGGAYKLDESGDGNDYIDAYLIEMNRRKAAGDDMRSFTIENLVFNLIDLWIAGMETTIVTLLWAFAFFLNHPDAQDRLRAEILCITGGQRMVELSDRVNMPFAHAVAIEVQRAARIGNFNLFHRTTSETVIDGYVLPKGTFTMAQLSVIMHDDDVFKNPDKFDPDRFLNVDRKNLEQQVIAFSLGKRACLGEGLAKTELFLIIMNLVQSFKISTVPGEQPPSLKAQLEGSYFMHRSMPYEVQIELCQTDK